MGRHALAFLPFVVSMAILLSSDKNLDIEIENLSAVDDNCFDSFEVDTLEIVLRELVDLVDIFFLVESNGTHKGVIHNTMLNVNEKKMKYEM